MHRPHDLVRVRHALDQLAHGFGILIRDGVADGIRDIDRPRTGLDHRLEDTAQEINVRAAGIFGGKLDIVRVFACPANRLDRLRNHLVGRHAQLLFHVDRRRGNKGMDAAGIRRADRLTGTPDVVFVGACQRTDGRTLDRLRDCLNGIEVTG